VCDGVHRCFVAMPTVMLCYRSAAASQVGELYDTGLVLMGLQTHDESN